MCILSMLKLKGHYYYYFQQFQYLSKTDIGSQYWVEKVIGEHRVKLMKGRLMIGLSEQNIYKLEGLYGCGVY